MVVAVVFKDVCEIVLITPERSLTISTLESFGYDEVRNIIKEFTFNNLDFSEYPLEISYKIKFKYK